ncbi:MAG: hypothetical protein Q9194_004411 [Teloschistes cf. exilis]
MTTWFGEGYKKASQTHISTTLNQHQQQQQQIQAKSKHSKSRPNTQIRQVFRQTSATMKALIISTAFALLASMVFADPAAQAGNSDSQVSIQYHGADPEALRYDIEATDGKFFFIDVEFSVFKIRVDGDGFCTFVGTDKSITIVPNGNVQAVGPPQTQFGGYCQGW